MKILIVTDTYYPHVNGSSSFNQKLAKLLSERGHDVLVIAPSSTFRHEMEIRQGIRVFGVRSVPILQYGYRYPLPYFASTALQKAIVDFKPDIVHFHSHFSPNTVVLPIVKRLGIPTLASNHFVPQNLMHFLHLPHALDSLIINSAWAQWRKTYVQFDAIVSQTQTAADIIAKWGFKGDSSRKIHLISNGINIHRFHTGIDGRYLRERYGFGDHPLVLYVGRVEKEKRIDTLIRAIASTAATSDVHCVIAGRGSEESALKDLANNLGIEQRVHFIGFVPDEDLPALYGACQCFCMPSIAELQSLATLEAMASGLPILAAKAMALPEIVSHERNGYLFEPDSSEQLAQYIRRLFSDESQKQKMGQESVAISKQHDEQQSITAFEGLYADVIRQREQSK